MGAGTSGDLRAANRAAVLGALVRAGELSRAELAEWCDLSPATVAKVVADLTGDDLVEDRGLVPSRGGRPIGRLGLRADGGLLLGAEVGDDEVAVELVDLTLQRVDDEREPLPADPSPVQVAAALRRAVRAVRARHAEASARVLGLGLSLPGSLGAAAGAAAWGATGDAARASGASAPDGTTLHVPGLGWPTVLLADLLGDLAGHLPVVPVGRAAALAAAELWRGALEADGRTLVVALGRDVGLAVVSAGRVDQGPVGTGEWGHTTVVPNGRRCRCGRRGCLEAYVGADQVVEAWRARGGEPPSSGPAGMAALLAEADDGEAAAVTALDMALDLLAAALGTAVALTGAGAVVVGGPAGEMLVRARGGDLAGRVRDACAAPGADRLSLTACRVPDAGAFGAALGVLGLLATPQSRAAATPDPVGRRR